ncbi:MAG: radical SAM protein, partial [Nitrospinota bacterium]|nr:radical SAM protein [Nitrospinota bacterium]
MLKINEIFKSIQGESSHTGLPCTFVRLTGCNLRCGYCDTEYAFYNGNEMSVEDVVKSVDGLGIKLVEITGGEPLLQEEVYPLMKAFLQNNYTVMLETGGSLSIEKVPQAVIKIVDLKCPGSGEVGKNNYDNLNRLGPKDEVKFVVLDRADYEWTRETISRYNINQKATILLSPVFDKLDLKSLAEWVLQDNLPARLQTQLHKFIWDKNAIGV